MKYKPLFARVLIEREVIEQTTSGIILPNAKKHSKSTGTVIAVGPTVEGVKVGDKVVFGRHAGAWLDQSSQDKDDGTLFICQDEDILCIVEEAA